ncbi:MAG: hypothetical protein CME21_18495 [Gemmatimonadetes bacterium]|nr:hypothetical protein [Gemmatimonadota bacterium]HCK11500.1 hypothetical protein [Candidatus Latescibacterota bacterium]
MDLQGLQGRLACLAFDGSLPCGKQAAVDATNNSSSDILRKVCQASSRLDVNNFHKKRGQNY